MSIKHKSNALRNIIRRYATDVWTEVDRCSCIEYKTKEKEQTWWHLGGMLYKSSPWSYFFEDEKRPLKSRYNTTLPSFHRVAYGTVFG
jgi:hypothetical protein